ncbi:MAG TPA: radical SAM protein [Caulobacteraceae bacterium]|nr:radical SAM protein [Caulobacteraceae bacterium]
MILVDNLVLPETGSLAELDVHPHLGLLALAASAEREGHGVTIFDPKRLVLRGELPHDASLYDRMADRLLDACPDVLGFTALGCSFLFAANVAERMKRRRPSLPILLGGPHATMLDEAILRAFPQFDVVVRHEADETFPLVLDRLDRRSFADVPGVTWRTGVGGIARTEGRPKIDDLDRLPMTDYGHYPVADLGLDLLRIEAGRGCPFSCDFCSTVGFFQRSFRLKSPQRLVAELDRLHSLYGLRRFKLDHDMFTANRKKVVAFCEAVRDRRYLWRVSARVDCVDDELLAIMADAGCVGVYFGIESGSSRMQRSMGKRLDLGLVPPTLARAHELGMETTASFITGFPDETEDDLAATLDLAGRCASQPGCLTQLHLLAPEPGTPLFERHGHAIRFDGIAGPYHAAVLDDADRSTILSFPEIFQTYYHYPTIAPRMRHRFAVAAVDLMRRLGPAVAGYLLRFFDGRLGRLVQAFEASREAWSEPPDTAVLLDFLAQRFGAAHHLTSLCRFALVTSDTPAEAPAPASAFDPDQAYVLPPGIAVLEGMHDCEALLGDIGALGEDERLEAPEADAVWTYLIAPHTGGAQAWRIDPDVAALASAFSAPLTPRRLLSLLERRGDDRLLAPIARLVGEGLLRAAQFDERPVHAVAAG